MPLRKGDRQKIAGAGGLHEMRATMQIERGRSAKKSTHTWDVESKNVELERQKQGNGKIS